MDEILKGTTSQVDGAPTWLQGSPYGLASTVSIVPQASIVGTLAELERKRYTDPIHGTE
ncbi:MAG: hypothetical protein RLZZ611_1517, partial [Cyanobacteriota bacterium]